MNQWVDTDNADDTDFTHWLQEQGRALGFSQIGISGTDLSGAEEGLLAWLAAGFHGEMDYMARHGLKRARPAELLPNTVSVITARMDYLPRDTPADWQEIEWRRSTSIQNATISVYARGRDYHKVLRQRLAKLAQQVQERLGPMQARVFTDSAPVLEVELAQRSGLGWRGRHSLLLSREAGSTFFLGEIFVDKALPPTPSTSAHCGQCQACQTACPTGAIVAYGQVDARRCISYLTIEFKGDIPLEMRPAMAQRIYGCDDCQLACPWNKFAQPSALADFDARAPLQGPTLLQHWMWSEADFLRHTEGGPIRRIGYEQWQRNVAVAMGNALRDREFPAAERPAWVLALRRPGRVLSALVQRHVDWALEAQAQD